MSIIQKSEMEKTISEAAARWDALVANLQALANAQSERDRLKSILAGAHGTRAALIESADIDDTSVAARVHVLDHKIAVAPHRIRDKEQEADKMEKDLKGMEQQVASDLSDEIRKIDEVAVSGVASSLKWMGADVDVTRRIARAAINLLPVRHRLNELLLNVDHRPPAHSLPDWAKQIADVRKEVEAFVGRVPK